MELPDGWRVWAEENDRLVLAYRPDVFDGGRFPAPCLPTVYVTRGQRDRRPGPERARPEEWFVTLYLEPDVSHELSARPDRGAALGAARELAGEFADGRFDYRGLYQLPREAYLEKLDELTGRA
jgi:hypothetical protein